MIQHIQESCELPSIKDSPTTLFENNVACIAHIKEGKSREIELNTFIQSSFIHTNSRIVVKLMFNKYAQVII